MGQGGGVGAAALQLLHGGRGDIQEAQPAQPGLGRHDDQVHRGVLGEAVANQVRHGVQRRSGGLAVPIRG